MITPSNPSSSTSSSSSDTSSIPPEIKAITCDPNNPKLNFVNGTQSRACGLPKSIKNTTTPTTPALASPTCQHQYYLGHQISNIALKTAQQ
jgi:hypothetical protein